MKSIGDIPDTWPDYRGLGEKNMYVFETAQF